MWNTFNTAIIGGSRQSAGRHLDRAQRTNSVYREAA